MAYSWPVSKPVTVAETDTFVRLVASLWSDDERLEFVDYIARNPGAGAIIPDTGGVRKIRWRRQGRGKRGGVRVIYYYLHAGAPLFLLTIYAKARRDDLSPDAKRAVQNLTTRIKNAYRQRS
jgi:hypothetical protein